MANGIFGFSPRLQGAFDARIARLDRGNARHASELNMWEKSAPTETTFNDAAELLGMIVSAEETHQAIACMMTYIIKYCLQPRFPFSEELNLAFYDRYYRLQKIDPFGKEVKTWDQLYVIENSSLDPDQAKSDLLLGNALLFTAERGGAASLPDNFGAWHINQMVNAPRIPIPELPSVTFNGKEDLLSKIVSEPVARTAIAYMTAFIDTFVEKS